jgi:hypothetical protein
MRLDDMSPERWLSLCTCEKVGQLPLETNTLSTTTVPTLGRLCCVVTFALTIDSTVYPIGYSHAKHSAPATPLVSRVLLQDGRGGTAAVLNTGQHCLHVCCADRRHARQAPQLASHIIPSLEHAAPVVGDK